MSKRMKKIITWAVGLGIVAVGTAMTYQHYKGNGVEKVSYTTQPLERGRVVAQVTATGTLSPRNTVQVGSQVSGRILELYADFNSQVEKDAVIAKIDPRIFRSNLEKAKANLLSSRASVTKAEANLEDAKQQYQRAKALAAKKLVAEAEVDTTRASYKSAEAQVVAARAELSQSKAALEQAKINLDYTTIHSPITGTVISRDVDVGQTVAASLQAPTLFTIAKDLREMELHTNVAESDVGTLKPEMPVTFTVDAFPDEKFRGVVKQIRNSPETLQNVVTYDAVVQVKNDELKLRPGMTANVTFIVAQRRGVLVVPNTALRFSPPDSVIAQLSDEERALVQPARRGSGRSGRPAMAAQEHGGSAGDGADAEKHGPPTAAKPAANEGAPKEPSAGEGKPTAEAGKPSPSEDGAELPNKQQRRAPRDPSQRVLWVMEGELPKPVPVKIGITDGTQTEITEGDLQEGALVITGMKGAKAAGGMQRRGGGPPGRRGFL